MSVRIRGTATIACLILLALVGLIACSEGKTRRGATVPTPPIRHRDAFPLLLTLDDLGEAYQVVRTYRLERGQGWDEQATRLSGYRTEFRGDQALFSDIVCQVECYLSVKDAQIAYRSYKTQRAEELGQDAQYTSMDQSETRILGDWGWMFSLESESTQAVYFVFLRENVLVEFGVVGSQSLDFARLATQQAQVIDQRIQAR